MIYPSHIQILKPRRLIRTQRPQILEPQGSIWGLNCNGSPQYADLGLQSFSSPQGTIEILFIPLVDTNTPAQTNNYVFSRNRAGSVAGDIALIVDGSTSNKLGFFVQDGVSTVFAHSNATNFVANIPVLAHCVWAQGGEHALYIDGVKQAITGTGLNVAAHLSRTMILCSLNGSVAFGKFKIQRFLVYKRVLSDDEIKRYAENHQLLPIDERNLFSYWKLQEGTGTVLKDEKGNPNGTVNNATWVQASIS